jgi:hypothetical protein
MDLRELWQSIHVIAGNVKHIRHWAETPPAPPPFSTFSDEYEKAAAGSRGQPMAARRTRGNLEASGE